MALVSQSIYIHYCFNNHPLPQVLCRTIQTAPSVQPDSFPVPRACLFFNTFLSKPQSNVFITLWLVTTAWLVSLCLLKTLPLGMGWICSQGKCQQLAAAVPCNLGRCILPWVFSLNWLCRGGGKSKNQNMVSCGFKLCSLSAWLPLNFPYLYFCSPVVVNLKSVGESWPS